MKKILLSTALLTHSLLVGAEEIDLDALFSLDIEQLQDIKVVTATKSEESINSVPSTVRVITDKMIKERGYLSLEDAISDLPGMQFRNIQGFNSYTFMRGAPNQNNLILMMVDGVVINELNSGGFYGGNQYDISSIKKIEVVYGPGSALYGTNAVSGVINIITYEADDEKAQGDFVSATIGSFNSKSVHARSTHYDKESELGYTLSAMYKTTDKTDLGGADGADNWSDDMENFEEDISITAKLKYKDLTLGMIFQDKKASMTTYNKSVGTDYYDKNTLWHIYFANIWAKHDWKINEDISLNSMLYYRNATVADDTVASVETGTTNKQTGFYRPNSLIGVEERLTYTAIENLNLTLGLVREEERLSSGFSRTYSNSYLLKPQAPTKPDILSSSLTSIYLQGTYNLNDTLNLIAGMRYEDSSIYDSVTTPRVSLVYNNDDTTVKLIYAEAFRAPKPWDYTDGTGNTGLLPEEMTSYELFIGQSLSDSFKVDMTFYQNTIDNKLTKDTVANKWINQGKLVVYGAEASFNYIVEKSKYFLNYTYTDSKDEDGINTDEIATHVLNTGWTYKPNRDFLTHLNVNYVGAKDNPATPTQKVEDYTLANASFSYLGIDDWKIDLIVKNIFDEEYYNTSNRPVSKYRQAERSVFLKASYEF